MISCATKEIVTPTESILMPTRPSEIIEPEPESEPQVIKLNPFKEKISETRTFEELGLTSSLEQADYFQISSSRWYTLLVFAYNMPATLETIQFINNLSPAMAYNMIMEMYYIQEKEFEKIQGEHDFDILLSYPDENGRLQGTYLARTNPRLSLYIRDSRQVMSYWSRLLQE